MYRRVLVSFLKTKQAAFSSPAMATSIKFSNGHQMPIIGYGMWQCDNPAELETALNTALENGYRHFDTAYRYQNEPILGKVVQKWLTSKKVTREDLFIVTKLPPQGNHPDKVSDFLQQSLENLKLDYVDLYLVHQPAGLQVDDDGRSAKRGINGRYILDLSTSLEQTWKAMEHQVDLGKAKSIGLSNCSVEQLERICKMARIRPANVQVELNAHYPKRALRNICAKNAISVTAFAPLGSPGRKSFYVEKKLVSEQEVEEKVKVPNLLHNPLVVSIARKYNKTCGQVLLKFLVQQGVAVLAKSVTGHRIQSNFQLFDFELTADDIEKLNTLDSGKEGSWQFDWRNSLPGIENHPEFQLKDD